MRAALLVLAASLAFPAAAGAPLDLGPVEVRAGEVRPPGCAAPSLPLCPVGYEDGGSPAAPGDDKAHASLLMEHVGLGVDGDLPPGVPRGAEADLTALAVEHPAFRALNDTWPALAAAEPAALHGVGTFESAAYDGSGDWGVFLLLARQPGPVDHPRYVGACWNTCWVDGETYLASDEDRLVVFPRGVFTRDGDSDGWLRGLARDAGQCHLREYLPEGPCLEGEVPGAVLPAADIALGATPAVAIAVHVEGAGAVVGRTKAALVGPEAKAPPTPTPGGPPAPPSPTPEEALPRPEGPSEALAGAGLGASPASAESPRPRAAGAQAAGAGPAEGWPLMGLAVLAGVSLAGLLLYHRITRSDALVLDTRRRVLAAVAAAPGIRIGTLAEQVGLEYTVVKRHVRLLERLGFLHALGDGQRHWFVVGQACREDEQAIAEALCNPAARAVYGEVQRGPQELAALAAALRLASSTVSTAAGRLVRAGLVLRELRAGCVVLHPARGVGGPSSSPPGRGVALRASAAMAPRPPRRHPADA